MAFWNRKKQAPLEERFAAALSEVCARDLFAKPDLADRSMRVVGIWANGDGTAEIQIRLGPSRDAVQHSVSMAALTASSGGMRVTPAADEDDGEK